MNMRISGMLAEDRIVWLAAQRKTDALAEMAAVIARSPNVVNRDAFLRAVLEREQELSTGIGRALAIPHARIASVKDFTLALGISKPGIADFDAFDGGAVHFVMMIAANDKQNQGYIKVLAKVVNFFKSEANCRAILSASRPGEILKLFASY